MDKRNQLINMPVWQEIMRDSYGGIMYDVANKNKYEANELLELWDSMTPAEQDEAGGIIKGAINFLREK